jgi:hypothetical protein
MDHVQEQVCRHVSPAPASVLAIAGRLARRSVWDEGVTGDGGRPDGGGQVGGTCRDRSHIVGEASKAGTFLSPTGFTLPSSQFIRSA